MMATLKEIAKLAGVSAATVSNALNPDLAHVVAPDTQKRIQRIAAEIGYLPVHHQPVKPSPQMNCVLITSITLKDEIEDEYWHCVRNGIYEAAKKRNMTIQNVFRIQAGINPSIVTNYDGVLILGSLSEHAIRRLSYFNKNIIAIDDVNTSYTFVNTVGTDLYNLTLKGLNLLKARADGPIAFIGGSRTAFRLDGSIECLTNDLRTNGYRDWLAVNNQPAIMKLTEWNSESGFTAINELLEETTMSIGGIMVASDPMAIGVVKGLREKGITPGDELPLISFDNIRLASMLTPTLTSFSLPKEVLGITAMNELCDLVANERQWVSRTTVPGHLEVGETYPVSTVG